MLPDLAKTRAPGSRPSLSSLPPGHLLLQRNPPISQRASCSVDMTYPDDQLPDNPTDAGEDTVVLTAQEFLEAQERLEQEASEVLPKAFDHCSFSEGYVSQSVYACKDCSMKDGALVDAGFCYGCFISCHTTHEVVELFNRRHFRCDCGTSKIGNKCLLMEKSPSASNSENKYNDNYKGIFCWCKSEYDPEKEAGVMLQCIACEDWFHDRCIGELPDEDSFEDFICRSCVAKMPFLRWYQSKDAYVFSPQASDLQSAQGATQEAVKQTLHGAPDIDDPVDGDKKRKPESDLDDSVAKRVRSSSIEPNATETAPSDPLATSCSGCAVPESAKLEPPIETDLFCVAGWRDKLCRCDECRRRYEEFNAMHLITTERSWEPPEDEEAGSSLMDMGMRQLNRIDRVQAIDGARAYVDLKEGIMNHLRQFAGTDHVITKDDIMAFFEAKLQGRKCD
ncbi:uncharacterized protein BJ171DRAFT_498758 [Polychytrium aggregatum]|uniref:uncharacterized protein n=1 Tax=Polychytrium aggregatum TaxID=110093 RepID=UPI0022FF2A02|nr:uncharacterized protein BJ171DRAFT_498758 [Polychytrium aggregatum]KAI9206116.1 hypothetical protein BJ171DRAFT_498758 [Polychytrium aggregatum]